MKKVYAQMMTIAGIVLFLGGLYLIYEIFVITKAINSQPNPPIKVILFENVPYCNCDIENGLAWNIVAVLMSFGLILSVVGIAKYNLVTHRA